MNVSDLRRLLADAPDDAPVFVVLDVLDGTTDVVTDGEVITPSGRITDSPYSRPFVQLQIESGAR